MAAGAGPGGCPPTVGAAPPPGQPGAPKPSRVDVLPCSPGQTVVPAAPPLIPRPLPLKKSLENKFAIKSACIFYLYFFMGHFPEFEESSLVPDVFKMHSNCRFL